MGCQIFTPASPTPWVGSRGSKVNLIYTEEGITSPMFMSAVFVGVVYNYTQEGVRRDVSGWQRCVSIPLVRPDMFHLLAQWDHYLERFSQGPLWDPACQEWA